MAPLKLASPMLPGFRNKLEKLVRCDTPPIRFVALTEKSMPPRSGRVCAYSRELVPSPPCSRLIRLFEFLGGVIVASIDKSIFGELVDCNVKPEFMTKEVFLLGT